ncbi:MAG: sodium/proton-translocating pyrophosphatase, partial [Sphaerochaeta sp.]|nr:sodium/proton-translocating pyrophosphatase [Sphaerochaeta sp.]
MELKFLLSVLASGLVALLFATIRTRWVSSQEVSSERLMEISQHISEGSMAFLRREYFFLLPFVVLVAGALVLANTGFMRFQALAFILGALASSLAGFLGMRVATKANARTTQAAKDHGLNGALKVAFTGGTVMGMTVVGLALVGLFAVFLFAWGRFAQVDETVLAQSILPLCTAFSLGASSVALFSR